MTLAIHAEAHPNLISDSVLIEETIQILQAGGGRVHASVIADRVLQIPNLDTETAALFITELIEGDARLLLTPDAHVELNCADTEARLLSETEFVVVDVETTGANAATSRITEIGAYRVRGRRIVGEFATLINPQTPIPPFISDLTGISNEMVRDAPPFANVAGEWLRFAHEAVLVAHNASFDVGFLNGEIARLFPNRRMANAHLCTVGLSRRILPNLPNHRLHTVASHFDITITNRHRAAGDALATAQAFIHLLDIMNAGGVRRLAEARKFKLGR